MVFLAAIGNLKCTLTQLGNLERSPPRYFLSYKRPKPEGHLIRCSIGEKQFVSVAPEQAVADVKEDCAIYCGLRKTKFFGKFSLSRKAITWGCFSRTEVVNDFLAGVGRDHIYGLPQAR